MLITSTVKSRMKEPPYFGVRLANVLKLRSFNRTFLVGGEAMSSNYGQKSFLVAVKSVKGHICFAKPFLLKMGCEISGWRFLKFWFFYAGFYCTLVKFRHKTSQNFPRIFKVSFNRSTKLSIRYHFLLIWIAFTKNFHLIVVCIYVSSAVLPTLMINHFLCTNLYKCQF